MSLQPSVIAPSLPDSAKLLYTEADWARIGGDLCMRAKERTECLTDDVQLSEDLVLFT